MPLPVMYAQARVVVQDNGTRQYEYVLWYTVAGGFTPAITPTYADDFATVLDGVFDGLTKAVLVASTSYVGVNVSLHDAGQVFTGADNSGGGAGIASGDFLPAQNAVVIRKGTAAAGRRGRGRWFLPLVPEVFTTGNILTGPGRTAYDALRAQLIAVQTVNGDDWNPAMLSRRNNTLLPLTFTRLDLFVKRIGRREVHPLYQ